MAVFGRVSKQRLATCDIKLQVICNKAIKIYDFTVICGHRNEQEQNAAFRNGNSKAIFPKSKHNSTPSQAVDIAPYPVDWEDKERFNYLATLMFAEAQRQGVEIKWGGHFDNFYDAAHFEI